jgi:hypothetical protein
MYRKCCSTDFCEKDWGGKFRKYSANGLVTDTRLRTDIKRCDILYSGVRRPSRSEKLFKIKKISSRNEQRFAERAARVKETRTARNSAICLMEGAT